MTIFGLPPDPLSSQYEISSPAFCSGVIPLGKNGPADDSRLVAHPANKGKNTRTSPKLRSATILFKKLWKAAHISSFKWINHVRAIIKKLRPCGHGTSHSQTRRGSGRCHGVVRLPDRQQP